jgi:chromosome segregation ATPase
VKPEKPTERTRDRHRFVVTADPGKPAKLEVVEEQTQRETIALTNLDDNRINIFLAAPQVSDAAKQALREIVTRKTALQQLTLKRQELERQVTVIEAEQKRIRENMSELPKDSDLFRRYVTKFTEQEDQIDTLRKQTTSTIDEESRLKKSLDEFFGNLNLS